MGSTGVSSAGLSTSSLPEVSSLNLHHPESIPSLGSAGVGLTLQPATLACSAADSALAAARPLPLGNDRKPRPGLWSTLSRGLEKLGRWLPIVLGAVEARTFPALSRPLGAAEPGRRPARNPQARPWPLTSPTERESRVSRAVGV